MRNLRIVFMGSPDFAVPSLDALFNSQHRIVSVVSNPDKRRGRRGLPVPTDVKQRALDLGLPVIDVDDVKSEEFVLEISKLKPDLLVVVAFRILPPEILDIPTLGSVNLHASLLPKYRGAAPIHWAVINGEEETGCTVFFLNERVDTGNIINQVKTPIGPDETTGDIYNRLKQLGADLLFDSIDQIAENRVDILPQNDDEATPAPKLFNENTRIDFTRDAVDVHNLIRGLNPFPVAWCEWDGKKVNIYRSRLENEFTLKPGQLKNEGGRLLVGCGDGCLELTELQLPGTKRLSGSDFINGYDLSIPLK